MRKPSANQTAPAIQVSTPGLKVVHSTLHPEKAITRAIVGVPTVTPTPVYYPSSYSKDGPGGNYQGL
jgi:hypothetical protein